MSSAMQESSPVVKFYDDAKIFITGATGFVGKTLIEKFLRVCPNINHIYALIRVKKGKDPQTRLKELLEDPLFKRLRKEKPGFENKIICIPGDVANVRLNMSASDYEFLKNEVTHVFHSAATVRFTEPLRTAVGINVIGTREIVEFCNKCIQLKVFVHVSTAYSFCVRTSITEDFYDTPVPAEKIINLMSLSDEKLNSLTPEVIKPWPNTYTFTKAIAENIVREHARSIPTLIFRPSIVMGTMKEPVQGWTDNCYGPTGIILGVGVGVMRVLYADPDCEANIVPVDLTVNAIISCAWEVGSNFTKDTMVENRSIDSERSTEIFKVKYRRGVTRYRKTKAAPKIYNFVSDEGNTLTWGSFMDMSYEIGVNFPSEKTIWYYTITLTNMKIFYWSMLFFLHYVPGFMMDVVLILLGKKPQMIKTYKKVQVFLDAAGSFTRSSWCFGNNNTKQVWSHLSERDKELFYFDMEEMNWGSYLMGTIKGIRSYLLKETEQTLPAARRKLFFFWIAHRLLQFSVLALGFWILSKFIFIFVDLKPQFSGPLLIPYSNST